MNEDIMPKGTYTLGAIKKWTNGRYKVLVRISKDVESKEWKYTWMDFDEWFDSAYFLPVGESTTMMSIKEFKESLICARSTNLHE